MNSAEFDLRSLLESYQNNLGIYNFSLLDHNELDSDESLLFKSYAYKRFALAPTIFCEEPIEDYSRIIPAIIRHRKIYGKEATLKLLTDLQNTVKRGN